LISGPPRLKLEGMLLQLRMTSATLAEDRHGRLTRKLELNWSAWHLRKVQCDPFDVWPWVLVCELAHVKHELVHATEHTSALGGRVRECVHLAHLCFNCVSGNSYCLKQFTKPFDKPLSQRAKTACGDNDR